MCIFETSIYKYWYRKQSKCSLQTANQTLRCRIDIIKSIHTITLFKKHAQYKILIPVQNRPIMIPTYSISFLNCTWWLVCEPCWFHTLTRLWTTQAIQKITSLRQDRFQWISWIWEFYALDHFPVMYGLLITALCSIKRSTSMKSTCKAVWEQNTHLLHLVKTKLVIFCKSGAYLSSSRQTQNYTLWRKVRRYK